MTLRDLIFIEDGNTDRLENGFINFQKMRMVARAITQLQTYQMMPFNLVSLENVQTFLETACPPNIEDEDAVYAKSLECESNNQSKK